MTLSLSRTISSMALAIVLAASPAVASDKATKGKPAKEKSQGKPQGLDIDLASVKGDPIVASVGSHNIKFSDVLQAMQQIPPELRKIPIDLLFLITRDQLIDMHVIKQESQSKKKKYEANPDVKEAIEKAKEQIIMQAYLDDVVDDKVSTKALKARYQKLREKFPKDSQEARIRQIVVKTEDEANDILALLSKGFDFLKLARERSIDKATAQKDGDLGYINELQKKDLLPEFAFIFEKDKSGKYKLETGKYTVKPVKTAMGWFIIKVEDRKPFAPPKFAEVKELIQAQLAQETIEKHAKDLKKGKDVKRLHPNTGKAMQPLEDELQRLQKMLGEKMAKKTAKSAEKAKK